MKEEICLLSFAVIFVTALVFGWLNITDALRVRGARRAFQGLSVEGRLAILRMVDQAAKDSSACTIMVPFAPEDLPSADLDSSRFGGQPYAVAGDEWPNVNDAAEACRFLIQVRLDQSVPPPWTGRLVQVFAAPQSQVIIRSYEPGQGEQTVELTGSSLLPEWLLSPVRIPGEKVSTPLLAYDPYVLLQVTPDLSAELSRYTRQPVDFLSLILAPNQRIATGFELGDIVQVGGEPVWLFADPGEQNCPECGRSMRFLFQFGDLNRGDIFGDAGVCYVFGCDAHPGELHAVVQLG